MVSDGLLTSLLWSKRDCRYEYWSSNRTRMLLHILNLQDTGSLVVCGTLRISVTKHMVLPTPGIQKLMIEVSKLVRIPF